MTSFARKNSPAFTLIEILVSIAILGVALIVLFELFSGSLKLAKSSEDYLKATLLAQKKMNDLRLVNFSMEETEESGEFEEDPSYRWSVSSEPYETEFRRDPKNLGINKIEVTIAWDSGPREKKFSLARLHTPILWHYPGLDPETLPPPGEENSKGKETKIPQMGFGGGKGGKPKAGMEKK